MLPVCKSFANTGLETRAGGQKLNTIFKNVVPKVFRTFEAISQGPDARYVSVSR